MGIVDHLSDYFDCSGGGSPKHKKKKQFQPRLCFLVLVLVLLFNKRMAAGRSPAEQLFAGFHFSEVNDENALTSCVTVEMKIKIDCEGCERKVKKSVEGMKGIQSIEVEPKLDKLTVTGYLEPKKVVARVAHRTGKKVELWPYVPYDVVEHPYAQGVYDRKAPAGYVRYSEDPRSSQLARASSTEVRYTTAFSDENPSACSIM